MRKVLLTGITFLFIGLACVYGEEILIWKQYESNPFIVNMEISAPENSAGSLVVADLNGDGRMDYLVTVLERIAAYANDGSKLWILEIPVRIGGSSEREGLPGHHGPGVQAVDIDGDSQTDVLFLTQNSTLHVVDGASGKQKWSAKPPIPEGAERWEHLIVCNFRGTGNRDLLLQTTNASGYRMGRYIAAYSLADLKSNKYKPLWERDDFLSCAHNGARVADLDGDSRDEVLGGTIINPSGEILFKIPLKGHIDSIFVQDVRPDLPGLEIVALEEGGGSEGNRILLYNKEQLIWETHFRHQEPQNAAIGEFDTEIPGLETWCRSRYPEHQKPFVFNARGEKIFDYKMDDVAPEGWTFSGVEVINGIDWTGGNQQLAAAKERHESGDVGIFDPMTGKFIERFSDKADRFYVADVSGDWREEMIVFSGNKLHIYHNPAPNMRPDHPRLWEKPHYQRSKMTWNYYSP